MSPRSMIGLVVVLLAPHAVAEEREDLAGMWLSEKAGLVIHEEAPGDYVGHPADMKGGADATWHFHRLGGTTYRFWVIVHGGGAAEKIAETEIALKGETLTVPVKNARGDAGELTFERTHVRIPGAIAEVKIAFRAVHKDDPDPDQYVDRRLADAFVSAVTRAREACPDLRRVLITATAGTKAYSGAHHRRDRRTGLCIGAVNGASLEACGEMARDATERLADGEVPIVGEKEAFGVAALTLLACLAAEKEVAEIHAPDLFAPAVAPFADWFLENRWRKLPGPVPLPALRERWAERARKGYAAKYRGRITVVVPRSKRRGRQKDVWDEKLDRGRE